VPSVPASARARSGDLALVVAALCFGGTFVIVQSAIESVEPVPFLAARFLLGAAFLWPVAWRRPAHPGEWRDGALAGAALVVGYLFQTIGLQYTSSATSAFITYLLVVFVPLLSFVVYRRRPHPITLVGILVAVVGLVLLTDPSGTGQGFGKGELLTLGCAVAFAAHVIILGQAAGRQDAVRLAAIQITVVGVTLLLPGFAMGGYGDLRGAPLAAAAATALMATAVAFLLQVTGQQTVPPARAAILLLIEPVFAAVIAGARGEGLDATQLLGAALILVAVVLSEVLPALLEHPPPGDPRSLDPIVPTREADPPITIVLEPGGSQGG
jgi:drug/metabolite transporter (DMT)-like permease